jgi:hypothetical protein
MKDRNLAKAHDGLFPFLPPAKAGGISNAMESMAEIISKMHTQTTFNMNCNGFNRRQYFKKCIHNPHSSCIVMDSWNILF